MQRIHHLLGASLSLVFLAGACDLPAAPVGKDDGDGNDSDGNGDGNDDVVEVDGDDDGDGDGDGGSGGGGHSGPVDGDDGAGDGAEGGGELPLCEDPCAGTEGQIAPYEGHWCAPDASQFISTPEIDCQGARENCLLNELVNPGYTFYCEWDGMEIHRTPETGSLCDPYHAPATCEQPESCVPLDPTCGGALGDLEEQAYLIYDCDSGEFELPPPPPGWDGSPTCDEVVGHCADILAARPGESLACLAGLSWLMYSEAVPGACDGMNAC